MTHITSINNLNSINGINHNIISSIQNHHSNTVLEIFSHHFQSHIPHLVAIYIKTGEQYHDLNFFYVNKTLTHWEITKRRLADEVFFRVIYQHYAVSRNEFIAKLDKLEVEGTNKKYCSIEVPNCTTQKYIDYVVINNLEQYLKNNL